MVWATASAGATKLRVIMLPAAFLCNFAQVRLANGRAQCRITPVNFFGAIDGWAATKSILAAALGAACAAAVVAIGGSASARDGMVNSVSEKVQVESRGGKVLVRLTFDNQSDRTVWVARRWRPSRNCSATGSRCATARTATRSTISAHRQARAARQGRLCRRQAAQPAEEHHRHHPRLRASCRAATPTS